MYQGLAAKDNSLVLFDEVSKALSDDLAHAGLAGQPQMFRRDKLATELFECWVHSATAEEHEPCLTILSVTKAMHLLFIFSCFVAV